MAPFPGLAHFQLSGLHFTYMQKRVLMTSTPIWSLLSAMDELFPYKRKETSEDSLKNDLCSGTQGRTGTKILPSRDFKSRACCQFRHTAKELHYLTLCSGGRIRTDTGLPPLDPKSRASANFATPPYCYFTSLSASSKDAYGRALNSPVRFIVANLPYQQMNIFVDPPPQPMA